MGDLDVSELLGSGAVVVHVPHERRGKILSRALPAIGPHMHLIANDRGGRTGAGAADTDLGIAVHGPVDRHRFAHAGLDYANGNPDERLGAGAAAVDVHIEIEPDAEIARDKGRKGRIVTGVRQHAVDIICGQAGIVDGVVDGPRGEIPRGFL